MSGLIHNVLKAIEQNVYLLILAGVLFLGPVLLYAHPFEASNAGLIPFLLSPAFLAVIVPQLSGTEEWETSLLLVRSFLFPLFAGLIFLICFLIYGTPHPVSGLKGVLFLTGFSIFLTGLSVFIRETGASLFVSGWVSTVAGLLLVGSFVYLSPIADQFYNRPNMRKLIIGMATQVNPVLAMSGGILEQDLLRGAYLYEHLSIGRYYSYSAPPWIGLGMGYAVLGFLSGLTGFIISQRGVQD